VPSQQPAVGVSDRIPCLAVVKPQNDDLAALVFWFSINRVA
jgi:hypothetical protein